MPEHSTTESPYVTPRELSKQLNEVYDAVETTRNEHGQRLARVETMLKVLIPLVPVATIFGGNIASAFAHILP